MQEGRESIDDESFQKIRYMVVPVCFSGQGRDKRKAYSHRMSLAHIGRCSMEYSIKTTAVTATQQTDPAASVGTAPTQRC